MASYDRVLIAPARGELERALAEAALAVNGRARERLLAWRPGDGVADVAPEGWRQWNGGEGRARSGGTRSAVVLAWWTDFAGRRHSRLVGRRGRFSRAQLGHLLNPEGGPWPPLALVYPDHVVLASRRGRREVIVTCACGMVGPPERVAWMGACCGPCHDRREEGEWVPPVWPRPVVLRGHTTLLYPDRLLLACSADGTAVVSSVGPHDLQVWDAVLGQPRVALVPRPDEATGQARPLTAAAFAPDGQEVVAGNSDGLVCSYSALTGQCRALFRVRGWAHDLALSPDGGLIAVAPPARGLAVWEVGPGRLRHERLGSLWRVVCLTFSPDGVTLAGGNFEGTVRLWDVARGEERPGPERLAGRVCALSFSADGALLAAAATPRFGMGGRDPPGPVVIWDVARCRALASLADNGQVTSAALLSPDGRTLLTGDEAGVVRAWDVGTGEEVLALEWHRAPVCGLALTAGGRALVSADCKGTVKVWPWQALLQWYTDENRQ
jgi:hypothetical protein